MKALQLIFFLLLTTNFSIADTKDITDNLLEYDIEIIIFEDAHARYINSETWDKNTPINHNDLFDRREDNNSIHKSKDSKIRQNTSAIYTINPEILSREYKKINNSSEYSVLFYSAWRQTGLKASEAFEINLNELENAHTRNTDNIITGNVKIVLSRYLHFYSQLEYQRKNLTQTNEENISLSTDDIAVAHPYSLKSHRRMRSKELHYIDHPLVGMLVQINPVETTQPNQAN